MSCCCRLLKCHLQYLIAQWGCCLASFNCLLSKWLLTLLQHDRQLPAQHCAAKEEL